ncbi:hypothetical protein [Ornithinibacillus contaminans]|uniref:hypothetical protein n=1 Tax=Ornithinibacillus contaminans TaxID=694055 RepID=UPI0012EE788A|nr:hypothetical protein [Ornithinibacillus contaminans]
MENKKGLFFLFVAFGLNYLVTQGRQQIEEVKQNILGNYKVGNTKLYKARK